MSAGRARRWCLSTGRLAFSTLTTSSPTTWMGRAAAATHEIMSIAPAPTALFAGQGLLTTGVCRALRRMGLQHQVALVGFDDIPLADLLEPGITVMAQDPTAMGRAAAELLFRRMDGDRSPSVHHVIPTRLITRGSGEIRP